MLRKILSVLVIVSLVCSVCAFASDTETASEILPSKTFEILNSLDIVTFDENNLEQGVKNEDFAMTLAYVSGFSEEQFCEDALKLLVDSGYMLKISSSPNTVIKQGQAVKAFISALGYDIQAVSWGGYPKGYGITAGNIGLLNGIQYDAEKILTYRIFCDMLYNALHIDITEQKSYGQFPEYDTVKSKTLLSDRLDIVKAKGRVTANAFTDLSEGRKTRKGFIRINGVEFTAEKDYNDFIGHNVSFYYKTFDDGEKNKILYMEPDSKAEETVTVTDSDFVSLSGYRLSYLGENGRLKSIELNAAYCVIYNGKALADYSVLDGLSTDFTGEITAIDSDLDGKYDFLNIKKQSTIFVGYIDSAEACIYDKYDALNNIRYDIDGTDYAVYSSSDGTETTVDKIKTGNVLTYTRSEDSSLYIIIVSAASVEGTLDSVNMSDRTVGIAQKEYEFTANIKRYIESDISIGDSVKAYLDSFGRVSGIEKNEPAYSEGVVVRVAKDSGIAGTVSIRMLTSENTFSVFNLSNRVKIDGKSYKKDNQAVYDKLWDSSNDKPYYSFIKCTINDANEITQIITSDSNDKLYKIFEGRTYWYSTPKSFGAKFLASGSAKVYIVPTDDVDNDDRYGVTTTAYLKNGGDYNVIGYTPGTSEFVSDTIIVRMSRTEDRPINAALNNFAVYDRIVTALDKNKNDKTYLRTVSLASGASVDIPLVSQDDVSELSQGDIFRYSTDITGHLGQFVKVYDKESGIVHKAFTFDDTMWSGILKTGYVVSVSGDGIAFTFDGSVPSTEVLDMSRTMVQSLAGSPSWFIYHTEESKVKQIVETASVQRVRSYKQAGNDCDKVIVAANEGRVIMIVMIRK